MKPVTVFVPDNQVSFFMELVNNLHFEIKDESYSFTDEHKEILDSRFENYQNNSSSFLKWEDVEMEIKKIL